MPIEVRETAESLLVGRREWSRQLVQAVDAGKVSPKSIELATLRKLLLHRDDQIAGLVKKHWGEVKGATTEEMRKKVDRLASVVSTGKGDPYPGKKLYTLKCATCHTLHANGGI